MSHDALIKQRKGGKSLNDLDVLEGVIKAHPGWTMTQASWKAAGFEVDERGFCQPANLFQQCLAFFNYKRRGSEAAQDVEELSEHPKARFKYGNAIRNPYEFGGKGVYPRDFRGVGSPANRLIEQAPREDKQSGKPALGKVEYGIAMSQQLQKMMDD